MENESNNGHLLKNDIKVKATLPDPRAQVILADALFPERHHASKDTSDDEAAMNVGDPLSAQKWRLFTKAKDSLPNGARLENLTWRMMAMALKKPRPLTPAAGPTTKDKIESTGMPMDLDSTGPVPTNQQDPDKAHSPSLSSYASSSTSNKYRYNSSSAMSNNSITIPADASQQVSSSLYPTLLKNTTTQKNKTTINNTLSSHPGAMSFERLLKTYYAALDHPSEAPLSSGTIPTINTNEITDPNGVATPSPITSTSRVSPRPMETITTTITSPLPPPIVSTLLAGREEEQKPVLTKCFNCKTSTTPLWRRNPDGQPLCNACGLFLKLHGVVRPLSLKSNVMKKRNRINPNTSIGGGNTNNSINFIGNNVGLTGVIGKRNNFSGVIQIAPNNSNNMENNKRQRRASQKKIEDDSIRSPSLHLSSSSHSSTNFSLPGLVIGSLPNYQSQHESTLNSSSPTTLLHQQQHNYFEHHPSRDINNNNMIFGSAPTLSWMGDVDQIEQQQQQQQQQQQSLTSSQMETTSLSQLTPEQLQQLVLLYQQQPIVHSGKELDGGNDSSSGPAWNTFTRSS